MCHGVCAKVRVGCVCVVCVRDACVCSRARACVAVMRVEAGRVIAESACAVLAQHVSAPSTRLTKLL